MENERIRRNTPKGYSDLRGLTSRVRDLHSYQCPCVVAVPIEGGNAEFLEWIAAETLAKV